ncbi:uncharacterized protein BX664DRAFT_261045 [Halteromyces radiatus]|uniref:uncharacterized protein n=1 Tax=Halteromyces radiatus TaxID=101107 RepID=UPI0022209A07|nr:uncharacterized protein BX664DRAFT_261045 [Halteromyces radiatus]KAI8092898.1 hypothetical protein BX664DRAFT_261045 [Halteromyces radiatus]
MLEFQKQILTNLVEEDSLLIISPGLGLFKIFCSFLQLYCNNDKHLIFLINTTQEQDIAIQERLVLEGVPRSVGLQIIEYDTPSEVSGIVIYNAHRVRPDSMEELILRIYREENEQGFIKAFSDQPGAFTSGFAPLQNMLKILQLRNVQLWPRFQVMVTNDLTQANEEVIELRQPMTEYMEKIQQGLIESMEATLSEVRKSNSRVDVPDYTFENSLFKSFDSIVRQQLDPVWHQVGQSVKQLVGDLKVLRQLLSYLTNYDCVSFNSFIETVITSNTPSPNTRYTRQSQWLFLDAADQLITAARKRVYVQPTDNEYDSTPEEEYNTDLIGSIPKDIRLVLEEQPKWTLLQDILDEIEKDVTTNTDHGAPVLVMVDDQRNCAQLQQYISQKRTMLQKIAGRYFKWRKGMQQIQQATIGATNQSSINTNTPQVSQRYPPNKRRRVRGGSATATTSTLNARPPPLAQTFRDEVKNTTRTLTDSNYDDKYDDGDYNDDTEMDNIIANMELGEHDILPTFDEIPPSTLVTIQCYENDTDEQILEDYKPRYIIMYDPDPAFVRRVEMYRALNPSLQVRVYFMIYDNSVEEQKYLSLIRKEKEAFEKLIREKSVMAIPLKQKPSEQEDVFIRTVSSRYGGGNLKLSSVQTIVVDMREFRSSLPPILHAQGVKIEPYAQCENMKAHYKIPILLIEFDQNKSFSLQNVLEMKENIVVTDLSSKLTLLTLAFPELRIIWSSSPQETTKIFKQLKETHDEPNAEEAALKGVDNPDQVNTTINVTPEDILRSMPGVTSKNYRLIMNKVHNLEALTNMTQKSIQDIIGIGPGKTLYQYLHRMIKKLKEQLDIQRIPVSEASRSLIDYCQENTDMMIPSLWGAKHPDPFAEQVAGCGTCLIM